MRKMISFCFALGLLIAGIWLGLVFGFGGSGDPHTPYKMRGFVWMASFAMTGLGGYWLWADFVAPIFGRQVD